MVCWSEGNKHISGTILRFATRNWNSYPKINSVFITNAIVLRKTGRIPKVQWLLNSYHFSSFISYASVLNVCEPINFDGQFFSDKRYTVFTWDWWVDNLVISNWVTYPGEFIVIKHWYALKILLSTKKCWLTQCIQEGILFTNLYGCLVQWDLLTSFIRKLISLYAITFFLIDTLLKLTRFN